MRGLAGSPCRAVACPLISYEYLKHSLLDTGCKFPQVPADRGEKSDGGGLCLDQFCGTGAMPERPDKIRTL